MCSSDLVSGSRITFAYSGTYTVNFSIQFANSDSQIQYGSVWLRKNDSGSSGDLADTNSNIAVVSKQGSVPGQAILTVPITLAVTAGDYLELVWLTSNAGLTIETIPSSGSPAYPRTPSVLVSVQQVTYTQLGPTGPTGPNNIAINTTTISGGSSGKLLYDNSATVGEATTGTGVLTALSNAVNTSGGVAAPVSGTTSMTTGFLYISAAAGAPSGTPTSVSGMTPLYYDTTNE